MTPDGRARSADPIPSAAIAGNRPSGSSGAASGAGLRGALRSENLLAAIILAGSAIALFATSDRSGGFWHWDSASHAFDGVFLFDFLRDGQLRHPIDWAVRYYDQYPAITLGYYPPGFALLLLPFYWLFGPSQGAAQALMAVASLGLAAGTFRLGQQLGWGFAAALAAALLLLGFPEMLLWERQIQPEVPCYAFAVWGTCLLLDWLEGGGRKRLYGAALLLVAALYIKQPIVFVLPVLLALVLARAGRGVFRQRDCLWAAGLAFVLLLPLAAMTIAFGGMNASQAMATPWHHNPLFYLTILPDQIGWVCCGAALLGAVLLAAAPGLPREPRILLFGWIGVGFLFFSAIALKESRLSTAVLPAVALVATFPFTYLANLAKRRWAANALLLAAAGGLAAANLLTVPNPVVKGFTEATGRVAAIAPPNSSVLLLAHRSADFIFDLRAYQQRRDLRVLRAEKLLTRYRVTRDFGIKDTGLGCHDLVALLDREDVAIIAIERGFWHDVPSIGCLEARMARAPFQQIASVPLITPYRTEAPRVLQSYWTETGAIDIYRRNGYVPQPRREITINAPLVGLHLTVPAK
jgi:4-amino-4-deoxy-L-arabinose transferase-like glycosyltransferase